MIYIFTRSYIIVNLWYQNLKLDKTYLPKGYLIFVISGMVSLHQVHFQNAQLYSTRLVLWTIKVEIKAVKGRKMGFNLSPHNRLRFLVRYLSPQY